MKPWAGMPYIAAVADSGRTQIPAFVVVGKADGGTLASGTEFPGFRVEFEGSSGEEGTIKFGIIV